MGRTARPPTAPSAARVQVVDVDVGCTVPTVRYLRALPTPGAAIWPQALFDLDYEGARPGPPCRAALPLLPLERLAWSQWFSSWARALGHGEPWECWRTGGVLKSRHCRQQPDARLTASPVPPRVHATGVAGTAVAAHACGCHASAAAQAWRAAQAGARC